MNLIQRTTCWMLFLVKNLQNTKWKCVLECIHFKYLSLHTFKCGQSCYRWFGMGSLRTVLNFEDKTLWPWPRKSLALASETGGLDLEQWTCSPRTHPWLIVIFKSLSAVDIVAIVFIPLVSQILWRRVAEIYGFTSRVHCYLGIMTSH